MAMIFIICKVVFIRNPALTGLDYVLIRSPVMLMIGTAQLLHAKVNPLDIRKDCRVLLLVRTITGGIGIPITFIGLRYLPSSKATLIINTHPLLVSIIGYYVLKEVLKKVDVVSFIGSFVGIILFAVNNTKSEIDVSSDQEYFYGLVMVIFSMIGATIVAICLRVINQHIHPALSPFYLSAITGAEMLILLAINSSFFHLEHYTAQDICLFCISAIFDYLAQLLKSMAYKYADASIVTPFMYSQMVFMLIADIFLFGYHFSEFDIAGGVMVTGFLLLPVFYKINAK